VAKAKAKKAPVRKKAPRAKKNKDLPVLRQLRMVDLEDVAVDAATIAGLVGLKDPRRLQQLTSQGVIPRYKRGQYKLIETLQAWSEYQRGAADGAAPAADLNAQRARREKAAADKMEFEMAVSQRQYLRIDLFETILGEVAAAAASTLDGLSTAVKRKFGLDTETASAINSEIYSARNAIAGVRLGPNGVAAKTD